MSRSTCIPSLCIKQQTGNKLATCFRATCCPGVNAALGTEFARATALYSCLHPAIHPTWTWPTEDWIDWQKITGIIAMLKKTFFHHHHHQKTICQSSEQFNNTMSKTLPGSYNTYGSLCVVIGLASKYSETRKYNEVIATVTHKSKNT